VEKVQRLEHAGEKRLDGARLHEVGETALLAQHPQWLSQRLKRHADVASLRTLDLKRVQHGTDVLSTRVVGLGSEHLLRDVNLTTSRGLHDGRVVANLERDVSLTLPWQPFALW
jgi:hypothetical protein